MSALATPTLRRLPVAGGLAACVSLGVALIVGPGGTPIPTILLAVLAAGLLLAEVGRRVIQLMRSGLGAQVLLGALVVGVLLAAWSLVVRLHAEFLALSLLLGLAGIALIVAPLIEARGRADRGATPWQALTGGPTAGARARDAVGGLGSMLLGVILLLLSLRSVAGRILDEVGRYGGLYGALAVAALFGALIVGWVARGLVVGIFRPLGTGAPAIVPEKAVREEQVVAAHLHDSVLQTLALIQRSASDPARVATLARQQERSLRAWLAGRDEASKATLAGQLRAVAQEVEDEQPGAVIEVVAVGDAALDRGADAMVRAAREAMRNAVRHAGSPVRVFLEVEDGVRELYVRDTGPGFDLSAVADERRGVRDAIIGRMEHVGGTATIESGPTGTEVALVLPPAAGSPPSASNGPAS